MIELLKTLSRASRVFRHRNLEDIVNEMIGFMKNTTEQIRKNPEMALECINLLSNFGKTEIVFEIFPEFKRISKSEEEPLSYLQTFLNIFKK